MATWTKQSRNTATWTKSSKNSATFKNKGRTGVGLTWEEATMAWEDQPLTWDQVGPITWTNKSKS